MITSRQLRIAAGAGVVVIVFWFELTHTTLLTGYGPHGTLTLRQAQTFCDGTGGRVARILSAHAAANCAAVDNAATRYNIAAVAAAAAVIAAAVALVWRAVSARQAPPVL